MYMLYILILVYYIIGALYYFYIQNKYKNYESDDVYSISSTINLLDYNNLNIN